MCLEAGGEGCKPGTGDACSTLGSDDHEDQEGDLGTEIQRRAHGVGHEQGRHGQVDSRAVEVEGVARGNSDTDNRLGNTQVLHLGNQAGQRSLGG
ncbi:hypothetical protein D3C73_1418430 [compost metagenome]